MSAKILIVDDDRVVLSMVERLLGEAGYHTSTAMTAEEGTQQLEQGNFDLLILDLQLPDDDGIELCRQIRARWLLPVIMLTSRSAADEKVRGLDVGADDYLTKPFESDELIARVKAHLRRASEYSSAGGEVDRLELAELSLDFNARDAFVGGRPCGLTSREFEVLEFLARHANKAMPREKVFERVWGYAEEFNTNSLDVIIYRIRNKIEQNPTKPEKLVTVRGFGYKLVAPEVEV